jgi:hypothetical protein
MTELEKIEYAKSFIDKLANGINPIDDSAISENDIVNNVRLSRCFFYVSDILRQVIENGGIQPQYIKRNKKLPFTLTDDQKSGLKATSKPKIISEVVDYLNSFIDQDSMSKIASTTITSWLVNIGLLYVVERNDGQKHKKPTEYGMKMGIFAEERTGQYGSFQVILYPENVQQFIYDNLDAIIAFKAEQSDPLAEFHSRPWTEQHVEKLTYLFKKGIEVSEIAYELKRTEKGVWEMLNKIGLLN